MSNGANHNCGANTVILQRRSMDRRANDTASAQTPRLARNDRGIIRHIYVHIPFCARICPYCAFYKDLLDRSQTSRFCEALLQRTGRSRDRRASRRSSCHRRFTSAAVRLRRLTSRNWNCCCADFTKGSNYRNWLNGRLKQIREASPRERQRF